MTLEQLEALRLQLPPFGERVESSAELQQFCAYYGIDYTQRWQDTDYRVGRVSSGPYSLVAHQWCRPGATSNMLLLHGYFDHTGLFGKLVEWGLSHHCNVLIFDLPGHGLSSGEAAVIDDFSDYSRAIGDVLAAATLPDLPLWVMAQSTGCAALIDFARNYPWPFRATVMLAPLVRPAGWFGVRLGERLLRPFVNSVGRKFAVNSSDKDFLAFVKRDPLQSRRVSLRWIAALRRWLDGLPRGDLGVGPALVIQGDDDGTVDWRYNLGVISQLFAGSRLEYLAGAGHQLANETEAYRRDYLQRVELWLTESGITSA